MNILVLEFITSVGGVQTVYKNILPHLAKNNKVFFLDPYQNEFDNELSNIFNIEVIDLPINSRSALGWSRSLIKNSKILFKYGFAYLIYLVKLLKLIKSKNINLIYIGGKKEIIFAYLLSKITRTKYVYHAHGFNSFKDIGFLYRRAIDRAEKVISVSYFVQDILIRAKVKKEKIQVVHNGLNIKLVEDKCKDLIPFKSNQQNFKVIVVGTIQFKKGIHILIKAVNILLEQGIDISLDIVGDITNELNEKYIDQLIKLSQKVDCKRISFLGFQKNVFEHINKANLLILPSSEESFGMVLIEAMYLSKPVIGSSVGGIPEVIADSINGFLFQPDNEMELAEKIKLLYNDNDLCIRFGRNGKERVINMFTTNQQAQKINDIISNITI